MAPDDPATPQDLERQRLLEEIRRRAEEAELKRIEDEEKKASQRRSSARPSPPVPPPPPPAPPPPPDIPPVGARLKELQTAITAALDSGEIDQVAEHLAEYTQLAPADPHVAEYEKRLVELRADQLQLAEELRAREEQKARERTARARKGSSKKRLTELMEQATSLYQQEKYERAMELLTELLEIDAEHEEALNLKDQVEKAQKLAAEVREEEARRKAERAAEASRPAEPAPAPKAAGDVWGTGPLTQGDAEYALPPESETKEVVRRPALSERLAAGVTRIRIPVKPIVTVLVVAIVIAAVYVVVERISTAVFPPKYSLIIYPAEVSSDDIATLSLSESLAEELIQILRNVSDLRVVGMRTAMYLRDFTSDRGRTARDVGARYYLQWTATRVDQDVHLRATLYDTTETSPRWSSMYKSSLRELPTLLGEIATELAGVMEIAITTEEQQSLRAGRTVNPAAYERLMVARYTLRHPELFSVAEALDACEQAVRADSAFEEAHLALARAHLRAFETSPIASRASLDRASAALRRAVALGSKTATMYYVWGALEQYGRDYAKAVELLEQAALMARSNPLVQQRLAVLYLISGRPNDALRAAERAATDDPRDVAALTTLGLVRQARGEYAQALSSYEVGRSLSRDRSLYASGQYADVLVMLQRHDEAIQILNDRVARVRQSYKDLYKLARVYQLAGKPMQTWKDAGVRAREVIMARLASVPNDAVALAYLGLVHTVLGEFRDAAGAAERALRAEPNNVEALYAIARMYALQNDRDRAYETLRRATGLHYTLASVLDFDLNTLRSDPDYLQAIAR